MKLQQIIEQLNKAQRKAFIPYVMAGDGGLNILAHTVLKLQQLGATAIEIGIPFTDPVADGPVIEEAGNRALKNGVTLTKVLETLEEFKEVRTVPIIMMTYLNPILAYGIEAFAEAASKAGVQAIIIPDMPLEERNTVYPALLANDIDLVQLVSLTSTSDRQKQLVEASEGFVYAVTVNGITGERQTFEQSLATHFNQLKAISPLPVIAGFGIATREHIEAFSQFSDGVIVGSKIVQALHENDWASIEYLMASPEIMK